MVHLTHPQLAMLVTCLNVLGCSAHGASSRWRAHSSHDAERSAWSAADYARTRVTAAPAPTPCPGWRGCDSIDGLGNESIRIWPKAAPNERSGFPSGVENGHCLGSGEFETSCIDRGLADVAIPTLTPFLVPNSDSAVIVAPGGAYVALAINREGTDIATWLNSIGVSAFVLKYRVPGRPWTAFGAAPLQDAQRSMGLVRQMATTKTIPGLNASKIGFMGFSAGSHLTGHLNVAWKTRTYPRVDSADDLPCRPDFSIMVYPWESVSNSPVNATPDKASANNITAETPPTMIVQAEDDPVHMENALFYCALSFHQQHERNQNC